MVLSLNSVVFIMQSKPKQKSSFLPHPPKKNLKI